MNEGRQRRARAAVGRHIAQVTRQPPAGIERRAKRGDRDAPDQRLEPEARGDGDNAGRDRQKPRGISVGDGTRETSDQVGVDGTIAQSGHHIGVGLVDQEGLGVQIARGAEQRGIVADAACALEDRSIVFHLPRHQHHLCPLRHIRQRGGSPRVVFAEPERGQPVDQPFGPTQLRRGQGGGPGDQVVQIAGAAGVVMDAAPVADLRQGRHEICTQTAGPQEPVLHAV